MRNAIAILFLFGAVSAFADAAPGTPSALHEQLMRAAARREFYTPTRIQQPTEFRESCCSAPAPRLNAPHPSRSKARPTLQASGGACTRSSRLVLR